MRRLVEILDFPKAWYRKAIIRRMFLGETSFSHPSSSEGGKRGGGGGVERDLSWDLAEEDGEAPKKDDDDERWASPKDVDGKVFESPLSDPSLDVAKTSSDGATPNVKTKPSDDDGINLVVVKNSRTNAVVNTPDGSDFNKPPSSGDAAQATPKLPPAARVALIKSMSTSTPVGKTGIGKVS